MSNILTLDTMKNLSADEIARLYQLGYRIEGLVDPVVNFGKVTVSTGYNNIATSIVLSTGDGARLPDPVTDGAYNLVWYNGTDYTDPSDDPNVEIVRVTAKSVDTLAITRAQEGTLASNKNTAGKTYRMILSPTKKTITDIDTQKVSKSGDTMTGILTQNGSNLSGSAYNTQSFINLIKNGSFELWNAGITSAPDSWVNYTGVTIARESTNVLKGSYSLALTYTGAASPYSGIYQSITPFNTAYFTNKKYTFGMWVKTATANQARIGLRDNVNQVLSAFHSGSNNWELLTVTTTVDPAGNGLFPIITMSAAGTAYFDNAILVEGSTISAFSPAPLDAETGNVGIGTTTPTTKLDVNGTIRATGITNTALAAGKLFADATGTLLSSSGVAFGNFTRDISLVSGTQSIIGVGFRPSSIIFIMGQDATHRLSVGFSNATSNYCVTNLQTDIAGWTLRTTQCIEAYTGGGGSYYATVSSLDSDGFTLNWTKGTGATGTISIAYMAFR